MTKKEDVTRHRKGKDSILFFSQSPRIKWHFSKGGSYDALMLTMRLYGRTGWTDGSTTPGQSYAIVCGKEQSS